MRFQCRLQLALKTFGNSIDLWVVGGGAIVPDSQKAHKGSPEVGLALSATVGGDAARTTEPCDPPLQQCTHTGFCGDAGQRDSFRPTAVTVNAGEDVAVAFRRRMWADKVYMDGVETTVGELEPLDGGCCVPVDLGPLTRDAGSCPLAYISVQPIPHEAFSDELTGAIGARVSEIVHVVEHCSSE